MARFARITDVRLTEDHDKKSLIAHLKPPGEGLQIDVTKAMLKRWPKRDREDFPNEEHLQAMKKTIPRELFLYRDTNTIKETSLKEWMRDIILHLADRDAQRRLAAREPRQLALVGCESPLSSGRHPTG